MVERILKSRLISLGYDEEKVESELKKFDFSVMGIKYTDEKEISYRIKMLTYEKPTVEIIRYFLNVDNKAIQSSIIQGELQLKTIDTVTNGKMAVVDFRLDSPICMVVLTIDFNIEIIIYNPNEIIISGYKNKYYEEVYSEERNLVAREYMDALNESGRLAELKVKEIINMLLLEFVIDELVIDKGNPRFKLYDNIDLYANGITAYSLKYINRRINRIEIAEKLAYIKRLGRGVKDGFITNDPYVKLDEVNRYADFLLAKVSYYWLYNNEKGQEEIAIYTANNIDISESSYSEYIKNNNDKIEKRAREITKEFSRELGYDVDESYIISIFKKLNLELIIPSIDIIQTYRESDTDLIEPIRYKYRVISDPKEFEQQLYISIEDNLKTRYRYKIVENVEEDLTTVGNKLNYTGEDGKLVRKQSIADFNINSNTAIIKRETLIDITQIPQLLGYIYEDMEKIGTDMLPVPTIEVDFYIPNPDESSKGVNMYNGTDFAANPEIITNANKFYAMVEGYDRTSGVGNTVVIVKYINSNKEILKENKITSVFVGETHIPEIIPIITDKNGKEWEYEINQMPNITLSEDTDKNIIEVKYKPRMTNITVTFINVAGKKIKEEVRENIQIGTLFDVSNKMSVVDKEKNEWTYKYSRPQKLIAREDAEKNKITLVYDVIKADVYIIFKNKVGKELKEELVVQAIVDRKYTPKIEQIISDKDGLSWTYINDDAATILVSDKEKNVINLVYDELKAKVITRHIDINGNRVKDDVIKFAQVGKEYKAEYTEGEYTDTDGKRWIFKECEDNTITVKNEENVITVIYDKVVAETIINIRTIDGKAIKDPIKEKIQIGSEYYPEEIAEVRDKWNKLWKCISGYENIIISENPKENRITLVYAPAMASIVIRYFDEERNQLIPEKVLSLQIGDKYKPEVISKLEDKEGKKWVIGQEKLETIEVKKQEEENVISLYYDKEMTSVKLQFKDIYGKELMQSQKVEAQIGSEYNPKLFDRITDEAGEKWGLEESDPKRMIVKPSGNSFILIYDEIKATVIVRYMNLESNAKIIENFMTKIRVGSIYSPNIREKIIDRDKKQWKFVGEKDISIIPKENEQENVLDLQYEPDLAKVIVRYQNELGELIREDVIKEVQIGSEVQLKDLDVVKDKNGLGWELQKVSDRNKIVSEKEEENIIINYYEPKYEEIIISYVNLDGVDIIDKKKDKFQLGKRYLVKIEDEITDKDEKMWAYDSINSKEIIVKEKENNIKIVYRPLMADTTIVFLEDEFSESIVDNLIESRQVGSIYTLEIKNRVIDSEGKYWKYKSADKLEYRVNRDKTKDIITCIYEKECVPIILYHKAKNGDLLKEERLPKVQIGSIYKASVDKALTDSNKLDWKVPENSDIKFKIFEEESKNKFDILYEKYLVNVYKKFQNENGEEIYKTAAIKRQAGSDYVPDIDGTIIDPLGREWKYNNRGDIKLFKSDKNPPIIVTQDENKNIVIMEYKPSLTNLYIKYQDTFGKALRKEEKVIVQIGSEYKAEIIDRIIDSKGNKWTFNPNSKISMKVNKNEEKNILVLAYEEQKAAVTFKYLDESNNVLRAPTKVLAQIGSTYIPEYDSIIEDAKGQVWEYKSKDLDEIKVSDVDNENVITLTYIPLKTDIAIQFFDTRGNKILEDKIVKAQLGSEFKPEIDSTIVTEESMLYKFKVCMPEIMKVKETPLGLTSTVNIFKLTYEPVYSMVHIKYQSIDGQELREDHEEQLQVGTKYKAEIPQFIKDQKDNQWQLVSGKVDSIRVMENPKDNIIKLSYEIASVEIIVRHKDIAGNMLKNDDVFTQQIGTEFIPKAEPVIYDNENKKWTFFSVEPVKLKVGSINNIITISYQESKIGVIIKYQDEKGKRLKNDERILAQIGSRFTPKITSKVIYDENGIWRFKRLEPDNILVSENTAENIIIQIYESSKDAPPIVESEDKIKDNKEVIANLNEHKPKVEIDNKEDLHTDTKEEIEDKSNKTFTDSYLKELEMIIKLKDSEKEGIELLKEYNTETMNLMHINMEKAINNHEMNFNEIYEIIKKEKETLEKYLKELITNDKSGNKILKIFEQITKSEKDDEVFSTLQQRKAIFVADYYLNKPPSDIEQATYICDRGKNDKKLEVIETKINEQKMDIKTLGEIKLITLYEKMLLDNYNKARNPVKDSYFIDPENSRIALSKNIIILVTNMLPQQALNILLKENNMTKMQEIELEAIMKLLNEPQRKTLEEMIDKIKDGRKKRFAQRMFKQLI